MYETIISPIVDFFCSGYFLILIFILGITVLLFPAKTISFKEKHSIIFYVTLTFVLVVKIPLCFGAYWSTGMVWTSMENKIMDIVFTISHLLLLLLYIIIGYCSYLLQRKSKVEETSAGVAFLASIILTPIIYFSIMYNLGMFLRNKI